MAQKRAKKPLATAKPDKAGSLRIIAGAWRGRAIAVLPGDVIRPTSDRVREALFNKLAHAFKGFRFPGARIVDVFAGTGALGLEALSRGAAQAVFFDRNRDAVELIKSNSAKLGAEDRALIMNADGAHLPRAVSACDLAFLDPPYSEGLIAPALAGLAIQGWLKPGALVSVETDAGEVAPDSHGYTLLDRRDYGRTAITILGYTP